MTNNHVHGHMYHFCAVGLNAISDGLVITRDLDDDMVF